MNLLIRPETSADRESVRLVHRNAFVGDAEARLVDALRESGHADTLLVAETGGRVVGHILFSRLLIRGSSCLIESLCLAPMAVLPEYQRRGIGTRLVEEGLEQVKQRGYRSVLVLGHPGFYQRLGFSAELAEPLVSPFGGGEAWMALELVPGALEGVAGEVEFAPPFKALE